MNEDNKLRNKMWCYMNIRKSYWSEMLNVQQTLDNERYVNPQDIALALPRKFKLRLLPNELIHSYYPNTGVIWRVSLI